MVSAARDQQLTERRIKIQVRIADLGRAKTQVATPQGVGLLIVNHWQKLAHKAYCILGTKALSSGTSVGDLDPNCLRLYRETRV
jgi:hypothetical protein